MEGVEKIPIKITLKDGAVKEGTSWETTPMSVATSISKNLAKDCIIAKVNGTLWDMGRPLEGDCSLELLKWEDPEAQKVFWHSSSHILGLALEVKYEGQLCIGPPLQEGGFYYDLYTPDNKIISADDFSDIKNFVGVAVSEKYPFERLEIPKAKALEMFGYNKFKVEIINEKVPDGETCTAYRCGPFIDLCRGPHVPNTNKVSAFDITMNSSAYWKGDANRENLQRVYGISFPHKKLLKEWQEQRRLAAERDHRLIGKNQELFMLHPYTPGSLFMLPHGTRIYNKLLDFMRTEYRKRGFEEVISPNIFNADLWRQSGHWDKYGDNIFKFKCEDQDWGVKPMNCPGHCLIFGNRSRSYRELPIRLADFGVLHRNEFSGALSGMTRVRRFQQDDAHIFCRRDQIQEEIRNAIHFMKSVYEVFGFEFKLELSTRPENFLGDIETWNSAEESLKNELVAQFGDKWVINEGDGAFYGPKIDVHVTDAMKRSFQCATIQLDFQLPNRFDLQFRNQDDADERPVMIHRAIFGSVERFMAVLIEHIGGKWYVIAVSTFLLFPFWQ